MKKLHERITAAQKYEERLKNLTAKEEGAVRTSRRFLSSMLVGKFAEGESVPRSSVQVHYVHVRSLLKTKQISESLSVFLSTFFCLSFGGLHEIASAILSSNCRF